MDLEFRTSETKTTYEMDDVQIAQDLKIRGLTSVETTILVDDAGSGIFGEVRSARKYSTQYRWGADPV
eukprot:scaffold10013_cov79-Skeletonema_dohrnii-CCMP3373.AAC.18